MSKTLIDGQASIGRFIFEAEECAKQSFGFAAMSTIFSVILTVSEAVGERAGSITGFDDKKLFKNFVPKMADKTWLISRSPTSVLSDKEIATELFHIRNGLAHQLSLPLYVGLTNRKSEVQEFLRENPTVSRAVCVVEFIEAVKTTVNEIIEKYGNATLDPNPKGQRIIAKRVVMPSGTSGSPASR